VTLTRAATTAGTGPTYTNASGLLQIANTANSPRFDYDRVSYASLGMWKEGPRTNLTLWSLDLAHAGRPAPFANGTGSRSLVGASGTNLDGTNTLVKITINRADTTSWAQGTLSTVGGLPASAEMVYSIYLQAARPEDIGKQVPLYFWNGMYVSNRKLITLTNTLELYFVTGTADMSQTDVSAATGYDGEATLSNNTVTGEAQFFATGEQFEYGSVPTSRIVTNGSAVSVAADDLSFTVPAGIAFLRATFDDNTSQVVEAPAGSYTTPATFNRGRIKTIAAPL
jgi:hypothetical protein